jgi:hypothetical protein
MKLVCTAIIISFLATSSAPSEAQRSRTPKAAGLELSTICKKAGHTAGGMRRCAQMITALCRTKGINPKSKKCWQWVLDQNDRRTLNMKALKR